jgi:hypothetical protein
MALSWVSALGTVTLSVALPSFPATRVVRARSIQRCEPDRFLVEVVFEQTIAALRDETLEANGHRFCAPGGRRDLRRSARGKPLSQREAERDAVGIE